MGENLVNIGGLHVLVFSQNFPEQKIYNTVKWSYHKLNYDNLLKRKSSNCERRPWEKFSSHKFQMRKLKRSHVPIEKSDIGGSA